MVTDDVANGGPKLEKFRSADLTDTPVQVRILQVPAKCVAVPVVQPPPAATGVTPNVVPTGLQATIPTPGPQPPSPSVMVIGKVATPGASPFVASVNHTTTAGRTVMITVPRAAAPQQRSVVPRLPQKASPQLPTNIQIPPGMMLIRTETGQLMLVSQQALLQQGPRGITTQAAKILTPQVAAAAGNKSNEKVTVVRVAAPPSFQPASVQKTAVVKVVSVAPKPAVVQNLSAVSDGGNKSRIPAVVTEIKKEPPTTYSQETLDRVKKCKNFLVTLIKLASSDSRSANMAKNVRGLVRSLLEGKLEAEDFTEQLYQELKSTPQPCLVPFLKKSLPAVRRLTSDTQFFIQQASASSNSSTGSSTVNQADAERGQKLSLQVIQKPQGVTLKPGLTSLAQSQNCLVKSSRPVPKHTVVQSRKPFTGVFSIKQPFTQDPYRPTKFTFNDRSGSYKEDDDINDVASMAGVNLREENAQILTTVVGAVVQSCQDQPFLSSNLMISRILCTGQAMGITEVGPEVVALASHATQEFLRGLIEKLALMAEHRKALLKVDIGHAKVSDVRSQLRFMEEVERLKKKRKDEEERGRLLCLAKSRSHTEDPQHQQLRQRAKELQQVEEARLRQREANLTALAAIGPRKRPLDPTESQVPLLPRRGAPKVTRVMLRDLLLCMEQDHFLCHSLTLYKAML